MEQRMKFTNDQVPKNKPKNSVKKEIPDPNSIKPAQQQKLQQVIADKERVIKYKTKYKKQFIIGQAVKIKHIPALIKSFINSLYK